MTRTRHSKPDSRRSAGCRTAQRRPALISVMVAARQRSRGDTMLPINQATSPTDARTTGPTTAIQIEIAAARRPSSSKQPAHHQTRCDKEGDDSGQREAERDSRGNAPAGRIDADQSQDENDEPDPLWRHRGCRVARSRCANRLGVRWRCLRYGPSAGQDLQLAGWCTWRRMRYFDRSATTAQGADTVASASTFRAKIDCDAGRTLSRLPSERNVSGQTPLVVRPLVQRVAER